MDLRERLVRLVVGLFVVVQLCCHANANMVFPVVRKFKGPAENLAAIKAHDAGRRGRFLSVVDLALGGNGRPTSTGLVLLLPLPFSFHFVLSHALQFLFRGYIRLLESLRNKEITKTNYTNN